MSKKLAVIISSIAAAVVAVVGVVFAGVWGTNTGVTDNTITVGQPATVAFEGTKIEGTILPHTTIISQEFTVDLAEVPAGVTYKLVLDVTSNDANVSNFTVAINKNSAADFATGAIVTDGMVLDAQVADNDTFVLKFTFSADAELTEANKILKFDLKLVQND